MSSIPLPALDIKPPADPLEQQQKLLSLQGLIQQQGIQRQQAGIQQQLGQQEVQKNQFEIQDREAGMKAMQQWDGKDASALPDLLKTNGASLQAVTAARLAAVKQQTDIDAMNEAQIKIAATKNDYLLGKLQTASDKSVPDEQLPQSVAQAVSDSIQAGYLDPQHGQAIGQIVQQYANDPAGLRSHLALFEKGLQSYSTQLAQSNKERELTATEQTAQSRVDTAATGKERLGQEENPNSPLNTSKVQVAAKTAAAEGPIRTAQAVATERAVAPIRVANSVAEAKQKAEALAPELKDITRTTGPNGTGMGYITAEDASGDSGKIIRAEAAKAGIPVLGKEDVSQLQDVSTVTKNLDSILGVLAPKLAKDPTGRFYTAPANSIAKLAQSDPDLKAIAATSFPVAIQGLRGLAGKIRITQAEVNKASEMLPTSSDTLPVAQKKVQDLKQFLTNTVSAKFEGMAHPQTGGAPQKTLSMTAIQQAAKDHGVSVDEAKRQAQAAGYAIQ